MSVQESQDRLMKAAEAKYSSTPLSDKVKNAFYEIPRHKFVPIYRTWQGGSTTWINVTEENLKEHLPLLYADHPLVIFGEVEDFNKVNGTQFVSTISQPSFVLRMIDLLKIEEGHRVFELGAGSGWNAALMGRIVGPKGKVVSVEIIPDLIERARTSIESVKLENVEIHNADGGDGWLSAAPFDRAIFTAGSYDVPNCFHEQIKIGGLLLFVLKNKGGGDNLFLLEKKKDHFESIYSMPCGFVPLTGKYHLKNMEETTLNDLFVESGIQNKVISSKKFWWASANPENFFGNTSGIKSFLSITEKNFVAIQLDHEKKTFGFWDKESQSLAIAYHDRIDGYGNETALNKFLNSMKHWIELGMPIASNFSLKVYPVKEKIEVAEADYLSVRKESQFIWSLNGGSNKT